MKDTMLIIISLFSVLTPCLGQANTYTFPTLTLGMTPISGVVERVSPLCPPEVTCITNGTVVDLEFTLLDCRDELAPLTYEAIEENNKLHIFISAMNLHNESSRRADCIDVPKVKRQIVLANQLGEVKLHFLGAN